MRGSHTGWLKIKKRFGETEKEKSRKEIQNLGVKLCQHSSMWVTCGAQSLSICWAWTFCEWVGCQSKYETATCCDNGDACIWLSEKLGTFLLASSIKIVRAQPNLCPMPQGETYHCEYTTQGITEESLYFMCSLFTCYITMDTASRSACMFQKPLWKDKVRNAHTQNTQFSMMTSPLISFTKNDYCLKHICMSITSRNSENVKPTKNTPYCTI